MRFMLLMTSHGRAQAAPGALPEAEAVRRMTAYDRELQRAGVLLGVDGLHPPGMGARVSFADGRARLVDGVGVAAGGVPDGYWMIDVGSLPEAIEWARRCPAAADAVIEVRQVRQTGDFPGDAGAAVGFGAASWPHD